MRWMPCCKRRSAPRATDDHIGVECPFYRSLEMPSIVSALVKMLRRNSLR